VLLNANDGARQRAGERAWHRRSDQLGPGGRQQPAHARGFTAIALGARSGKLVVLRMDRVSFMDQSGAYALQDALVDLKSAGLRILICRRALIRPLMQ
jgi:hypothetical protein